MTHTLEPTTTSGADAASERATAWLTAFEDALKARDVATAAGMFATESYWRDLVSFTWNLKTVEGRDGVADLLTSTLEGTDPSGFGLDEPADEADGVTTAWFHFETALGRGRGLLRLDDEDGPKAFTFLTSLYELTGHEEPRGEQRDMGAQHGATKHRETWQEKRQHEAESLGSTEQHYALVIGGGQGGIALGAPATRAWPPRSTSCRRRTTPADRARTTPAGHLSSPDQPFSSHGRGRRAGRAPARP